METQPFDYQFYVLNTPDINAFAVPGGKVFLNSGLILMVESEDELAGVMAHEIGHVVARHIARQSEQGTETGPGHPGSHPRRESSWGPRQPRPSG